MMARSNRCERILVDRDIVTALPTRLPLPSLMAPWFGPAPGGDGSLISSGD